ncbi:hypothetical protein N7539_008460 [Penicillium diatomitis]|uniref:Uncharacterized protein n=1 Tax=Penicillium diatomitis TaxID=2819901 RepID=A0A9X0BNC3_9EURO|nr:hypothetical protein N7539_008460 [Penicillium diatomitis]
MQGTGISSAGTHVDAAYPSLALAVIWTSPQGRKLTLRFPTALTDPSPSTGESPAQCGNRPGRPVVVHHRPLQAPGTAGPIDGEQQGYLTAYTTRLVTSVVCRGSIPARGDITIRQPALGGFSPRAVASLLRCVARRPIRIQLRRAGQNRRVPARILT